MYNKAGLKDEGIMFLFTEGQIGTIKLSNFGIPNDLYQCKSDFNILSCITIFHPPNFCPKTSNKSYFFLNDDRILGILMANINRRCVKEESANKSSLHEIY